MPQMAPMSWMLLFSMFTLVFLMYNYLNSFLFKYSPKTKNLALKTNKIIRKLWLTFLAHLIHQQI